MAAQVLRIVAVNGGRVLEVPIGPGDMAEAKRLFAVVAALPSVREGRRRVEIVPAGVDR